MENVNKHSPQFCLLETNLYFPAVKMLFTGQQYRLIKTCLPENTYIMKHFRQPTLVRTMDFYKLPFNEHKTHIS